MASKKTLEDKYKKYELLEHILALPDTYVGSIESTKVSTYVFDKTSQKMEEKQLTYIPGLLKIFDEVIVNAIDHSMRLKSEEASGKEDVKHVKNIKISINKDTGYISVYNDGNGVDIKKHSTYGDLWIPELIFGELLTSTNYDKNEEKIWGGKNGYGSKLTNIFSTEFTIETIDHYSKKIFTQTFKNNMTERNQAIVKACSKNPYTMISFLPDYKRFGIKNITDDIYKLFERRVIDACASTSKDVSVYFNDEKISIKDFEKYCNLYIEDGSSIVYEKCGDRWEVAVAISKSGSFEQISFVNGINTIRGGKHIEYITNMITKNLVDMAANKKKKNIKTQHIKDNICVFVKALIVNPSFDSQSKETLTTPVAKFGSKCDLSDKFFDKLFKLGIIEKAISLTEFHDQKKLVKTDGKKISKIIVPKLDDANLAGTKYSSECTLILTEGDSAKTMAITGLSVIGRDRYGVFPLRGKVLNVKDATLQKISDNNEIIAIKKILGLEQNKKYTSVSQLRYGSIMIMTDQDHDGSHIKGLIFNVFQSMWHELYKINGFITSMLTPIIKASNSKGDVVEFYNMTDYDKWSTTDIAKRGSWKIKYYKGLGTSNDKEAKEYFKEMKKITYKYDEEADEAIDLAFNKKRADDRKDWLGTYNKDDVLDYTNLNIPYKTFIDKDLIHFSNRDLQRSINHICDGLKESTRKILFSCFKRKLYTNEIKVAQLSGYVSEVSAYHHGEASLQQAIIGMAQIFVGTNNINLLMPNGQFGSRCVSCGADASSPRYIYTLLSKLCKVIFKEEDNYILNYQEDDGQQIEPEYYIPVIPMILVNGGIGIGTGYSTNIPQFNPTDLINVCRTICDMIKIADVKTNTINDLDKIYDIIDLIDIPELVPYYLGFKGTIEKTEKNTYMSKGIYNWIDNETLEITELPIGIWTEDYKDMLEAMITNNQNNLKYIENHYTSKNVKFILHFNADAKSQVKENFENTFKLASTKNMSINNMHLFNEEGVIKKYNTTTDIIKEWAEVRIRKYFQRKVYQINILEKEYTLISAKVKFILDVISGTIQIMNKKFTDIASKLVELNYPKIINKTDENDDDENNSDAIKGYLYLLKMPISQLTYDRKIALEKQMQELVTKLQTLKNTKIEDLWLADLKELENEWNSHKEIILRDYQNDIEGIIETKQAKKKTKK